MAVARGPSEEEYIKLRERCGDCMKKAHWQVCGLPVKAKDECLRHFLEKIRTTSRVVA